METVAGLPPTDLICGMNYRNNQFDPTIFWADPVIRMRFPLHAAVARSYLAAMLHEATCERTFSYTGRVMSKLRTRLDPDQVCASALCVAGDAVHEVTP